MVVRWRSKIAPGANLMKNSDYRCYSPPKLTYQICFKRPLTILSHSRWLIFLFYSEFFMRLPPIVPYNFPMLCYMSLLWPQAAQPRLFFSTWVCSHTTIFRLAYYQFFSQHIRPEERKNIWKGLGLNPGPLRRMQPIQPLNRGFLGAWTLFTLN